MGEDIEAKHRRWKCSLNKVQKDLAIGMVLPSHLYHYSKLDGIRGILTSRQIWLSDIGSMNDPIDGRYWIKVFKPIINHKSVPAPVKDLFQRTDSFGLGSIYYFYLACFSAEPDLENQWREYASDETGGAIELSFDSLMANCDGGKEYGLTPMVYDAAVQEHMANQTIDAAIMLCRNEDMTAAEKEKFWKWNAVFSFLQCGLRFKDPNRCREREWRIFRARVNRDDAKYRDGPDSKTIPYLTLDLKPKVVTGLIKGSSCTCPDADLVTLLTDGSYGTYVRTHHSEDSH